MRAAEPDLFQPLHASTNPLVTVQGSAQYLLAPCCHAQQSLLGVLHDDPARTHGAPVHLLAEAAHGVAELADVQRAAQVRICRAEGMVALHSLPESSAGDARRKSAEASYMGHGARESWPQAHLHSTT